MIYAAYHTECDRCKIKGEAVSAPPRITYWTEFSNHRYWKPHAWAWFDDKLYCQDCLKPVREHLAASLNL